VADATIKAIGLPFDEAIDHFRSKVLKTASADHASWTEMMGAAHARAFTVAGAASHALLSDFQTEIAKAIKTGSTGADWRKTYDAIVQKHGWQQRHEPGWRAQIIYETNMATAHAAGRYAQMTDPDVLEAYPFWRYVHSGSRHPRLQHLGWNGLTLRADDPWWDAHYPPNGWRCGCRVSPLSGERLRRGGRSGPDHAPASTYRPWTDQRTGQVHMVPNGIDPGWDYNVGKAWKQGTPPPVAPPKPPPVVPPAETPGRAVQQDLARWLEQPRGNTPAGRMTDAMRKALDVSHDGVLVSEETMEKQRWKHGDLSDTDYVQLPAILAEPTRLMWGANGTVIAIGGGERQLAVAVKGVPKNDENFITTVYPAWRRKVLQWLERRHVREVLVRGLIEDVTAAEKGAAAVAGKQEE